MFWRCSSPVAVTVTFLVTIQVAEAIIKVNKASAAWHPAAGMAFDPECTEMPHGFAYGTQNSGYAPSRLLSNILNARSMSHIIAQSYDEAIQVYGCEDAAV